MYAWRPWLQLHSKAAPGAVQKPHNTTSCPVPALSIRGKCLAALVLLFCNLSHGFCQSSWKQVAVGGAEQLSCSPWECGRSAIHLARVEHLVYASVSGTYTPEQWEQQTHPASSPKTTSPTIYLGQLFSLQKCPTINREIGAKAG